MFEIALDIYKYGMGILIGIIAIAGTFSILGSLLQWVANKVGNDE